LLDFCFCLLLLLLLYRLGILFVDGCEQSKEKTDGDANDFQGRESDLKEQHVEEEGETDAEVAHDADSGRVRPLINPRAQILPAIIQHSDGEDKQPLTPRALRKRSQESLLLAPNGDACHHARGQRVVPLNDDDGEPLEAARRNHGHRLAQDAPDCHHESHFVHICACSCRACSLRVFLLAETDDQDPSKSKDHSD